MPEFGFSISAFSTWKNFLKHVWQPQKIIYESIISWPDICYRVKGSTDRIPQKNKLGPTRTISDPSVSKSDGLWNPKRVPDQGWWSLRNLGPNLTKICMDDELTVRWYPVDTKFVLSKIETDDGIYRTFIKVIRTTVLESES